MKDRERDVILTIESVLAAQVFIAFGWAEIVFEASRRRLTIPSYTDPQVSGKRTPERQRRYISRGKSWWRGDVEQAPHVLGRAIHLGLRDKRTGRYISWSRMTREDRQIFMLVVRKMESMGWLWFGSRDSAHFDQLE